MTMIWSDQTFATGTMLFPDAHGKHGVVNPSWSTLILGCVVEGLSIWDLNRELGKAWRSPQAKQYSSHQFRLRKKAAPTLGFNLPSLFNTIHS
jgi:hypothetical protein